MVKFYNSLSPKLTMRASEEADKAFCTALDLLTLSYKLVFVLEHEQYPDEGDMRLGVALTLKQLRSHWTKEFLSCEGKITKKLSVDDLGIQENLGEVISEIEDQELMGMIFFTISET